MRFTTHRDIGVLPYVSPRQRPLTIEEARVRAIAYALKQPQPPREAISAAVEIMAPYVHTGDVLVPIPNSRGDTTSNRVLARALAIASGASVADVLRRAAAVPASHERRRRGLPGLSPEEHGLRADAIPAGSFVFIDNVVTTGATFEAARRALGRGRGLAFARANEVLARG